MTSWLNSSLEGHFRIARQDRWGNLPLADAKMGGHLEIITYLLRKHREQKVPTCSESNGLEPDWCLSRSSLSRRGSSRQPLEAGTASADQVLDVLRAAETKLNNLTCEPEPAGQKVYGSEPEALNGTAAHGPQEPEHAEAQGPEIRWRLEIETEPEPERERDVENPRVVIEPTPDEESPHTRTHAQPTPPRRAPKLATVRTVSIGQRSHRF